jgi:hypothetical protein
VISIATIAFLLIASVAVFYLGGFFTSQMQLSPSPTPTLIPFDYNLTISPTYDTIMQGESVKIYMSVAFVEGSLENVTLNVSGIPVHAYAAFNQPQGSPTNSSAFNSTLTITTSTALPSSTYNITINATADNGKARNTTYVLSVLNSKVTVSGTITAKGITPTKITFQEISPSGGLTGATFTGGINGIYYISLPNKALFAVSIDWMNTDGSKGTHNFILPFSVDAGVGVTSINCPIGWG